MKIIVARQKLKKLKKKAEKLPMLRTDGVPNRL